MKDVLGFNIKENGFLSAVPYIGFWAGQVLTAYLADLLQSKKILSTTWTRKLMTGVGKYNVNFQHFHKKMKSNFSDIHMCLPLYCIIISDILHQGNFIQMLTIHKFY